MSKRRGAGPPFFRQARLVKASELENGEAAAARALQLERDRRATECLAEVVKVLERYRCTFQVVTQTIYQDGRAPDLRSQVNVVPLDTPAPAAAADPSSKPAAATPNPGERSK